MNDPLCRVTIQCAGEPHAVDLALPRHQPLGLLMPDIVDLAVPADRPPQSWRLDRLSGARCDESASLHDGGVHDGDVIVLVPAAEPGPRPVRDDVFRTLIGAPDPTPPRTVGAAGWAVSGVAVAVVLAVSGAAADPLVNAALAVVLAAGCLVASIRSAHPCGGPLCVLFAGTAAFLGAAGAPVPARLLFTAGVCCTAALIVLRTTAGQAHVHIALASAAALVAVGAAASVTVGLDTAAAGAVLTVLSIAVLGGSGRLALLMGRIRPGRAVSDPQAARGRALLSGLVTGAGATTVVASALVALGCWRGEAPWVPGMALTVTVAALLLIRTRLYADPWCRAGLGLTGLACVVVALALAAAVVAPHAGWCAATGLAAAAWWAARRPSAGPVLTRTVDVAEYGLLTAVVPLSCWVAGCFDLVRSAGLG